MIFAIRISRVNTGGRTRKRTIGILAIDTLARYRSAFCLWKSDIHKFLQQCRYFQMNRPKEIMSPLYTHLQLGATLLPDFARRAAAARWFGLNILSIFVNKENMLRIFTGSVANIVNTVMMATGCRHCSSSSFGVKTSTLAVLGVAVVTAAMEYSSIDLCISARLKKRHALVVVALLVVVLVRTVVVLGVVLPIVVTRPVVVWLVFGVVVSGAYEMHLQRFPLHPTQCSSLELWLCEQSVAWCL